MHTLERNVVSEVRSDVDSVMTTIKTKVKDALMTAIENLVVPRIELAMKSFNASSGHELGSFMLDLDHMDFP